MNHTGRITMLAAIAAVCLLIPASGAVAETVAITPTQDATLYENFGGNEANGAGPSLYAGETACCGSRRALLLFDIAGNVPAGATIDSVSLELVVSLAAPGSGPRSASLHPVDVAWGEGTSAAGGAGGFGIGPTPNDATWDFSFYNTTSWTSPGGDFQAAANSTILVDDVGLYAWNSGLEADVQGWLDNPASNFGWLLMGDESQPQTAKRYDSREGATSPRLTIDYTVAGVCGDGVVDPGEICDDGNTVDGDGCAADCGVIPAPVPTAGEWGLIVMTLLLLTVGTLLFGRLRLFS